VLARRTEKPLGCGLALGALAYAAAISVSLLAARQVEVARRVGAIITASSKGKEDQKGQ